VCSACADHERSAVRTVQPSRPTWTCGSPIATIGSIVMTRPSLSGVVSAGSKTLGTSGSSWMRRPNAVPHEPVAEREAAPVDDALHARADRVERHAGPHDLQRRGERLLGGAHEPCRLRADLADGDGAAGVGVEAVELGGDVELDEVAAAQDALAGDAVDGLVIDADARRAGKVVVQPRARAGACARELARGDRVELGGRDPGPHGTAHGADRLCDDRAGGVQRVELLGGIGGHLLSVAARMHRAARYSLPGTPAHAARQDLRARRVARERCGSRVVERLKGSHGRADRTFGESASVSMWT
jgi:hypothetical protein